MKVVHLIAGLGKGGAETTLVNLVKHQSKNNEIEYRIISMGMSNYYESEIRQLECELVEINLLKHPFVSIRKISQQMKECDLFCSWMYNSNLLSYFIAKLSLKRNLIWFVRHADLSCKNNSLKTIIINKICAKVSKSKCIKKIVYNGNLSKTIHEECGYDKTKSLTVNNGCDLEYYKFNPDSKEKVFTELGVAPTSKVILSIARYNIIKDIPLFISSLSTVKKDFPDVVGVMCGRDIDENNKEILLEFKKNGLVLGKDIFLLGRRDDLPDLLSACDLYVLHSAGEAFPNVLVQAMSCKCMCVSTDVGDVKYIISQDAIVPPKNVDEMVKKINYMLNLTDEEKEKIKLQNVKGVSEKFDIKNVILTYEEIFLKNEG